MKVLAISLERCLVAFVVLAIAGCGLEEDPQATDAMVEEAVADATEKGFNVTSFFAQTDYEYDDYDDEKGYVRLNVAFGTGGCVGVLNYHEDGTKIVLEVERAVLGTEDEMQTLIVFDPTAETLAQNAALNDCFVVAN